MRSACKASSRKRDLGTFRGAYLVKRGCRGSRGLGVSDQDGGRVLWGGVGGSGCANIAKFCMEGLHFLHTDVFGGTPLQLVHRGGWVEVDVVGERVRLKGEGHALEYHLLIEV